MPRSVLLDESRDVQWPLGLPGYGDKVRIQPTLAEFIDRHRPRNIGKGQFLINSTVNLILVSQILGYRWNDVHADLGKFLGLDFPPGNPIPNREASSGFASLPEVVNRISSSRKAR